MPKVHEIRKERATQAAEARRIVELAITEQRDNTPEERASVDGILARMTEHDRQIGILERVEAIEADGERSLGRRTSPLRTGENPLAETKHQYSLLRSYRCLLGIDHGGLESEISQEIGVRSGKAPQGIYIPWDMANPIEQRSLNAGVSGTGGVFTGTGGGSIANVLGTELIELLRNKMVLNRMGARVMTDMSGGTFSLPKQTSGSTAYWVAEGNSPTGSNLTIGQVTWTPKTCGAFTDLTRRFILQTNQSAEALARDDLSRQLAIEMDRAGLNGSGTGFQPLGILQDPNIPTVALGATGGAPTWANVVALEKLVAQANAEFGKLGYVTSNAGRAMMKQTPKIAASTFPIFLWENDTPGTGEGEVNGSRAMASEQIPSNLVKSTGTALTALIYGNWDSATYAFWSGLDLMIDPYSGSTAGTVRFVALQDLDIQFRYEKGFAKTTDMATS